MKKLRFIGTDTGFGINNNAAYYIKDNKLVLIDCGGTVFSRLLELDRNCGLLKKRDEIEVIITHMHDDHTGSLSTLLLYCKHVINKKIVIVSKCLNLKERLLVTGLKEEDIEIVEDNEIEFIKTVHAPTLDCYGIALDIDGKRVVYTGDTAILDPFLPYLEKGSEFYTDISFVDSNVHLSIKKNLDKLKELSNNGVDIYLMHLDNEIEIKRDIEGTDIHLASEDKLYKEDIINILKSYNFDSTRYEVISGAAMVLYGYKEWTRDIDFSVSEDYYVELLQSYNCTFERVNSQGECIFYIDSILNFGHSYYRNEHNMIEGIPVQTKENLIALKKKLNRKKDRLELELIK